MNSTESHQTTNQATPTTMALTHSTTMTEITTKLDSLPREILMHIAEFTGANSCYLGYGVVNKRINQLFNTYSNKLSKKTSYGGYATFQDIVEKCETELEKEIEYPYFNIPDIFHQLASGVVTFNREDLLEWALEIQNENIFHAICVRAIKDGKLLIIERVWDIIRDESLMDSMKENTHFACIAAKKGRLDCLKYLHEQGFEWNEEACEYAAEGGHLDCLVYLHEQGCPWNEEACSDAARGGNLDCLIYLHEHGCEWNDSACHKAAWNGHLDCLMYLHEQGCPWSEKACGWAAMSGHLDCLVYLHEQGCPWNEGACEHAAYCGHLDCLAYMRDYGLEWERYGEYLDSTT